MIHPAVAKAKAGKPLTKHEQRVVARGGYFTGAEAAEVIKRAENAGEHLGRPRRPRPSRRGHAEDHPRQLPGAGRDGHARPAAPQRPRADRGPAQERREDPQRRPCQRPPDRPAQRPPDAELEPAKFAQITNKAFRYAVLPQPRWLVGNFFEPLVVRMPGVGSGINVFGLAVDVRAANRLIGHMERHSDPAVRAAAAEIRAHQFGGLLFGNKGLTNRRTLEDFPALDAKVREGLRRHGRQAARDPADWRR
jgi:hypothetical protein